MNIRQRLVLIVTGALLVLSVLLPPWQVQQVNYGGGVFVDNGYAPYIPPAPKPTPWHKPNWESLMPPAGASTSLDLTRYCLQVLVIFTLAGTTVLALADRKNLTRSGANPQ